MAERFYAFTENVTRQKVVDKADHIAPSLDEILYHNKMESKKVRYIFDNNNVMISKYQLIFLYTLIFWALIYLFLFVKRFATRFTI